MVWRKVILSFILISCILLVAASGSPANAAEDIEYYEVTASFPVTQEAVSYIRDFLAGHPLAPGQDYVLCSPSRNYDTGYQVFLFGIGEITVDGLFLLCDLDSIYVLCKNELDKWTFEPFPLPMRYAKIQYESDTMNFDVPIIYSNKGSFLSLYERSDIYQYTTLILLGTGICCYLLRSVFDFCLRRNE